MGQPGKASGRGVRQRTIAALGGLIVLAACSARQSGLSIAPPKVYNDSETRKSLSYQSDRVVGAAQQVAVGALQQFAGMREVQQGSLRGGFSGAPGVALPTPPPAPSPEAALPALPAAVPATGFGALLTESLDDLAAKEAEIESIRLLYAADTTLAGKNARLYMVRFDIMINPSRQNYFTYFWRPFDCFHLDNENIPQCRGLRNYTEDFQAVVRFDLPTLPIDGDSRGRRRAPVEVYAVQPTNQTVTALDSMASAQGMEVAAAAAWNGMTGQGEYETRAEEQFAEQRKYPLIQGIVDNPTRFRFIFNPRRHTVRRSAFISWIPGVGRYSTSLSLDPGVRRVYAYLLVRDPDILEKDLNTLDLLREGTSCRREARWGICAADRKDAPAASIATTGNVDAELADDSGPPIGTVYTLGSSAYEQRHFNTEDFALVSKAAPTPVPRSSPPPRAASPATASPTPSPSPPSLGMVVRGRYVRYGDPYRNDPLFFEDPIDPRKVCPQEGEWCDEDLGARFLDVHLPVETRADEISGNDWKVASAHTFGHFFRVEPPEGCDNFDVRHVKAQPFACDASHTCVAMASSLVYRGQAKPHVLFELSPLPKKPSSGAVQLRFYLDAGSCRGWTPPIDYHGPWSEVQAAAEKPATLAAKSGSALSVIVPAKLDAGKTVVVAVRTILFGEHVARVIDTGKRKANEPFAYTVIVPESLGREVDLIAELDVTEFDPDRPQLGAPTRNVTRYVKLGTFTYAPHLPAT